MYRAHLLWAGVAHDLFSRQDRPLPILNKRSSSAARGLMMGNRLEDSHKQPLTETARTSSANGDPMWIGRGPPISARRSLPPHPTTSLFQLCRKRRGHQQVAHEQAFTARHYGNAQPQMNRPGNGITSEKNCCKGAKVVNDRNGECEEA